MKSSVEKFKGILNPQAGEGKFHLDRLWPSDDLSIFVERYWIIRWDLRGRSPHRQETLPNPCVNLVFEKGNSRIYGVFTGRFSQVLKDQGQVFGIKFRPGGFYPFYRVPIFEIANASIRLEEVFDVDVKVLEEEILTADRDEDMVEIAETFLRSRLPEKDANVDLINRLVDCIMGNETISNVEDLAAAFRLSTRTLQRLFRRYVGIGPKWVIARYRIQEAVAGLDVGGTVDWARFAVDLGYFDQAHFVKDFKALVGKTPTEYAACIGAAESSGGKQESHFNMNLNA